MEKHYYGVEQQAERCRMINTLITDYNLGHFNETGDWTKAGWRPGPRECIWFATAFLESGRLEAIRMANRIIRRQKLTFCEFIPMFSILILLKYGALLEPETKAFLEGYVKNVLDGFMGPTLDFVGVNDNFPSMATFTALIGGKMFEKPELYDKGRERLGQLRDLLTRRGVASEYNSPTYSPGQIYPMSQIANFAEDPAIRELALKCEERLWADLMGHVHPETFQVAGPFSRAYTVDSTGHTHQSRYLLYALFGDRLTVSLKNTAFATAGGQEGEVLHQSAPFVQISAGWLLNTTYHCPDYLAKLALEKEYPYEFTATTEFSSSTDAPADEPPRDPYAENSLYEYPAGVGRISTYMTADYALGVATNDFHNGEQTNSFHILYRRKAPVRSQKDISTVYCKYLLNEKKPLVTEASLPDEGRKIGLQSKNTAMMLYKPKLYGHLGVSSMRLSIILPVLKHFPDEILLGDKKLDNASGESTEPCSIFIKDGPAYFAFHPVHLTDYGRKAAVRVENQGDFIVVSFYNYEGKKRDFAERGFLLTRNGFVAEVRSELESGSFQAFIEGAKRFEIRDDWMVSPHSRQTYIRRTTYERAGLRMDCEYSPVSEGVKFLAVNGRAVKYGKLAISGFDMGCLPFINENG